MEHSDSFVCWHCGKGLELPEGPLSFSATCEHCDAWLHCCLNCHYYQPGLPNDCKIPNTDQIADREKKNFCDEFRMLGKFEKKKESLEVMKQLFGDEEAEEEKKGFGDLFD